MISECTIILSYMCIWCQTISEGMQSAEAAGEHTSLAVVELTQWYILSSIAGKCLTSGNWELGM